MLILTFALEVDLLPQECTETINLITFPSLLNIILYYLMAVGNNNALMTLHSIYFFSSIYHLCFIQYLYVYAAIITLLLLYYWLYQSGALVTAWLRAGIACILRFYRALCDIVWYTYVRMSIMRLFAGMHIKNRH
jgi:hypothetical protein